MARRYRTYRRRGTYRGRRYYGTASRRGFSAGYGKAGFNLTMPFIVGAAVGYGNMDAAIPAELTLAAAAAPVRGIGTVKGFAQGVLIGNLAQSMMKNKGLSGKGSNFGV